MLGLGRQRQTERGGRGREGGWWTSWRIDDRVTAAQRGLEWSGGWDSGMDVVVNQKMVAILVVGNLDHFFTAVAA
jgi:hypothetical protein